MTTNTNNATTNNAEYELTCVCCGRDLQDGEYEWDDQETVCHECLERRGPDEQAIEAALLELLNRASMECEEVADVDFTDSHTVTFATGNLLTRENGVVLRLAGGQEFQITIVQSKDAE